jgi:hypothetical protein
MVKAETLDQALKEARLLQAAQLEAMVNVQDARVLRLEALRDSLLPDMRQHEALGTLFELNVQHGDKPKLWLDLISVVEMEPDPRTYCLVQDREGRREVLFETRDLEDMRQKVVQHLAHRMVEHERKAAGSNPKSLFDARRYALSELVFVWFSGFAFGILILLAYALATGVLKF